MNHNITRDKAIKWAQEIISKPCVFLDVETTGLGDDDEVVQIALTHFDKQSAVSFDIDRLFIPLAPISKEASAVTGWTLDKLREQDANWFGDDYGELYQWLAHKQVVAFNAVFDQRLLDQTCEKHRFPIIPTHWECAMLAYARFWGDWNSHYRSYRWQKLTKAIEQQGLQEGKAHDAMGDVGMMIALVRAMAQAEPEGDA